MVLVNYVRFYDSSQMFAETLSIRGEMVHLHAKRISHKFYIVFKLPYVLDTLWTQSVKWYLLL